MMLVEPDPVIAEPVELLPGVEMLGIGPRRDFGLEMPFRQRIGQLVADLQMIELLAIGQEIKDKDFHALTSASHEPMGRTKPVQPKSGLLYREAGISGRSDERWMA